jgi:mono/diheme cytochrome c family protein
VRALTALILLALGGCQQAESFAFQNTSITLPEDTVTLPAGPGAEAVATNCLACHSPEMILTQPRLTRKVWEAEVEKMAKVYKAPIDAKDVPQIVDYLVAANERLTPEVKTAP